MELITGYFTSRERALEVAERLRKIGFKGEISVIGQKNYEDFQQTNYVRDSDVGIVGVPNFGIMGTIPGSAGPNAFLAAGTVPLFGAGWTSDVTGETFGSDLGSILDHYEVSKRAGDEIKSVVGSGNTVIFINGNENEKHFIRDTLLEKGAQNIHC